MPCRAVAPTMLRHMLCVCLAMVWRAAGLVSGLMSASAFIGIREMAFRPAVPPPPVLIENASIGRTLAHAFEIMAHTARHFPYRFRAISVAAGLVPLRCSLVRVNGDSGSSMWALSCDACGVACLLSQWCRRRLCLGAVAEGVRGPIVQGGGGAGAGRCRRRCHRRR
jgi:hypothetical protein